MVWEGRSREAPPYPDCATALRVTAPLGCGSKRLGRDGQRRATRCLTDSSARSWSSAASVSPAPRRGPARFPRPILDARLDDGSRVAICVPPATRPVFVGRPPLRLGRPKGRPQAPFQPSHENRYPFTNWSTFAPPKWSKFTPPLTLIPDDQRIVAIEDTLELPIDSPNRVRFEARRLQQGAVTIRDLVRHALRHRPDHIVVGEVRGAEAADLLQALNTGHGGSPATPPPR